MKIIKFRNNDNGSLIYAVTGTYDLRDAWNYVRRYKKINKDCWKAKYSYCGGFIMGEDLYVDLYNDNLYDDLYDDNIFDEGTVCYVFYRKGTL